MGVRVGRPSAHGQPSAPAWSTVDRRALGGPWDRRGLNTRSTHGSEYFLHDPTVQIVAGYDRMAEVDSKFDHVISGPDVHDRMA